MKRMDVVNVINVMGFVTSNNVAAKNVECFFFLELTSNARRRIESGDASSSPWLWWRAVPPASGPHTYRKNSKPGQCK